MHRRNWDDLRYVLAVAEGGSVSAAARELNVNHATVLRRVALFEDQYGIAVFNKLQQGYAVSDNRADLIEAIRDIERAVLSFERLLKGAQTPLHGDVRITSTDTFCNFVLPPMIAQIQAQAIDLRLELLSTNAHLDMTRLQADITVRPAAELPEGLAGEVAAKLGFGLYARDASVKGWLGLSGVLQRTVPAQWMKAHVSASQVLGSADSFLTLREMAAQGAGQVLLPCIIGDTAPDLVRLHDRTPEMSVNIWVASHIDIAELPRIKLVRQQLRSLLADAGDRLMGKHRKV